MSKKVKIWFNYQAVRALLNNGDMVAALSDLGSKVQQRAGDGYELNIVQSTDRKKAIISAETIRAKKDNLKNNTLLKALK